MSSGSGHIQIPRAKTERIVAQTRKVTVRGGGYTDTQIHEPEDERDDNTTSEEDIETENYEDSEDDEAHDAEAMAEDDDDPFFEQRLSLLPCKWSWMPIKGGASRLVWGAADLSPRLDALEIFRLFVERSLNDICSAEILLFGDINKNSWYSPPSPLDLEGFYLQKWLAELVKINAQTKQTAADNEEPDDGGGRKQFSWRKYLSGFTIEVTTDNGYRFMQPDRLICSPGGGGKHLRDPILRRWMSFEVKTGIHKESHFNTSQTLNENYGWIYDRTREYVKRLNAALYPLLGENVFADYEESSLKNKLTNIKGWLFGGKKSRKKG
ncbi:hypothetical protein AGMMS50276_00250 [Synergistales bacterium]|nr:hypothetical protein AGMMS50276_00250 [Synergistales bacterium]